MHHDPKVLAAKEPATPLTTRELVSNDTLRNLVKGEPEWQRGEISPECQSMLSMILPDICGELLAYRLAADAEPHFPPRHPATNIGE